MDQKPDSYVQMIFRSPSVEAVSEKSDRGSSHGSPMPPSVGSPPVGGSHHARRRSSIVNTTRRYSDGNIATYEAFYLSGAIFEKWDVDNKGFVTIDQVKFDNVSPKFCEAIGRVMSFGSQDGRITIENVAECIAVLKSGPLQAKVKLLLQFMDSNGNGEVSFDEIKQYLRVVDDKMMDRLGLSIQSHIRDNEQHQQQSNERRGSILPGGVKKSVLTYEDILSLFEMSDRGNEAITIFCDQILRVLSQGLSHLTPSTSVSRRNSIILMGNEFQFPCCSYFGCCSGWLGTAYFKIREHLKHVSHVQIFKFALVLLQIFLWLFYFFYHKTRGYPLAFCFAKGFGLNLRILSLLVYFTMARTAMGHLYTLKLVRPFIPLGINIEVHSFIGFCIVMHAFGHTFGHIAYKELHTKPGFETAFTQNSLLRGNNWENKLKGDGKTGFILLALLIIMGGTALFRAFSSVKYKWFYFCHFLYLLYLPMLFLHMPELWPYFIAITALMVVERAYDLFQNTLYTTLAASRPCANGITFLSVPRFGMQTYPGSYYRIRIPSLSPEWHPFSLAGSTSSHHLYFFIASAGDWTRDLHKLVSDPMKRSLTLVQVQGPFLAPASQALIRKPKARILCVASGIGITPFFSLMATKVTDEVNYDNERIMYRTLFADTKGGPSTVQRYKAERNSLLEVLQKQRKIANAVQDLTNRESHNGNISLSKENSNPNLLSNVISSVRRNTNSNLEALAKAALAMTGNGNSPRENATAGTSGDEGVSNSGCNTNNNSQPESVNASRSASNTSVFNQAANAGSRSGSSTNVINGKQSSEQGKSATPYVELRTEEPRESLDLNALFDIEEGDAEDEQESVLKVVWSIRELSELSFYVDYVHHLVKAQEQLIHTNNATASADSSDETKANEKNRPSNSHGKPRVAVEVEVFLTGLGSRSDPVYMLSQTLFLLSIAHMSSTYMKVHFGRPDLEKLVKEFDPEEVYYCGGNALKSKLSDVCRDAHIEFHPEDFDAGGGDFVRSVYKGGAYLNKKCQKLFFGKRKAEEPKKEEKK